MAVNYIIPAGFRWFRHMAGAGGDQVVDEPDAALTESTDELCALRLDPDPGSTAVLPVAPDPAGAHAKLAHQAYADAVRYAIEATGIGVQWCRLNEMAGYREIALALAQSALVARWPDWHAIYAVWSETRGWSYWLIRRAGTEPERKTYWHDPQADPVLPGPKAVADWLHRLLTSGGGDDVATASDPYSPAWRPVGHDSKFEAALAAFAADPGHLEAERARRAGAG